MPPRGWLVVIASTSEPCEVQVAELQWERIQLVVRLRSAPESTLDLTGNQFFLRSTAPDREPLPAINAREQSPDPGERLIRFNVFAGPGRMPLEPGRWELWMRRTGADAEWCPVGPDPSLAASGGGPRDFMFGRSMYRVDLRTGAERPLSVVISVWATAGRDGWQNPMRRLSQWSRRSRRTAWVRLFRAIVGSFRSLPRSGRLIVFTSDSRTELGGNLKLIYDRMVSRGLDRRYQLRTIFKPSIRTPRTFRGRLRLVWLLAMADVILLDDYQPAIYHLEPRPDVRIIQLWHAWGAFKTVGYSRIGKPGGTSPYSSVHKNYTYATVSSAHEVPFYAEAFGIPEDSVIPTGTPRMDEFLDRSRQRAGRDRALQLFPAARDRRVLLFAPTFRGAGARQARYPMGMIDLEALHAVCGEVDAVVIFKMHPFVRRRLEIPAELGDRLIDASGLPIEVNDLLVIADLLITDYSSLVFEYSTLNRPMLFFAYDLETYVASRDFYEPFEQFVPGRIVRTFPEVLTAIRRQDYQLEKVAPFARRHLPEGEGTASDRIIDELILRR